MRMTELMEGVFAVGRGDLPQDCEFYRAEDVNEAVQPLKHICERSNDETQSRPTDIVVLKDVTWSYDKGFYYCTGCKSVFDREGDLEMIWGDGKGTGHEGIA
jgi:hypothetical protein